MLLGPIIGGLSHTGVKLWGRASKDSTLYAWLSVTSPDEAQPAGKVDVTAATGFAGAIRITRLQPETNYHYALSLSDQRPAPAFFRTFKTAPPPGQRRSFQFAFGSCFLPSADNTAGQTFHHMLQSHDDLAFAMMLGDQIYADEWKHNSLGRIAVNKDDFRAVYQHTWSNPSLREFMRRTPVYMTLDDHEVDNDWHWRDEARQWAEIPFYTQFLRWLSNRPPEERHLPFRRVREALQVWWEHQGMHAPDLLALEKTGDGAILIEPEQYSSLAYTFYYGGAAFFVMDSRSMRIWNRTTREILGAEQWRVLEKWLLTVKDIYPVKFIATSSACLHILLGDFAHDRWSSFPDERDRLLRFIAKHNLEHVYLLTGDLHSGHAISTALKGANGQSTPLWEFCSSPFEQQTNYVTCYLTLRHPPHRLWKDYRVHFVVNAFNYGIVKVEFSDTNGPSVHFDLHYLDKRKGWKVKQAG